MKVDPQKVDALFEPWNKTDSPGCAVAVLHEGELVYQRAFGMADLERNVPLSVDSVFDIGSTGKQFTAAVIACLAGSGLLSLDDPVQKYIPELPAYPHPLLIHHLLHHTSGLRDYTGLMAFSGWRFENYYSETEILDLICRQQALNFAPGEEFVYSNSGYFLLGVIARRVTGKPLAELIRVLLLEPLGMSATCANDDATRIVKNRAVSYSPAPGGGFTIEISPSTGFGDGAILTTVGDLARWDENFYHSKLECGQEIIQQMITSGRLNSGQATGYGLGLFLDSYRGLKMAFHGGSWAGYRAEMVRFPEQHFTILLLCNTTTVPGLAALKRIADLYLADKFTEPAAVFPDPASGPGVDFDRLVGFYRHCQTGAFLEISLQQGMPAATIFGRSMRIAPLSGWHFHAPEKPYWFHFDFQELAGEILLKTAFEINGPVPDVYHKIDNQPLDHARLPEYCGAYFSGELALQYTVIQEGTQLILQRGLLPPAPLKAVTPETFTTRGFDLTFLRDGRRQVIGFKIQESRVRGLVFSKQNS